jgi:hypothetical protein
MQTTQPKLVLRMSIPGGTDWQDSLRLDRFRCACWSRGPALQREYDAFKPQEAEAVAAMCKRFDALCLQLSRVGMAPTPRAAIQHTRNMSHEGQCMYMVSSLGPH